MIFDYSYIRTTIYLYKSYDLGYVHDYVTCICTIRTTENTENDRDNAFPKLKGELTPKGGVIVTIFHLVT